MNIIKTCVVSILGLMVLSGCGGSDSVNQSSVSIKPHKINKIVNENFKKGNSEAQLKVFLDETEYKFDLKSKGEIDSHKQILIDMDRNSSTGYTLFEGYGVGAEYLVEDGHLFKYEGTGGFDWSWSYVGYYKISKLLANIPPSVLENANEFDLQAVILDENWDARYSSALERATKILNIDKNELTFNYAISGLAVSNDSLNFYLKTDNIYAHRAFFIDSDLNIDTGYSDHGYEYLLEDKILYRYTGTDNSTEWSWEEVDRVSLFVDNLRPGHPNPANLVSILPKELLPSSLSKLKMMVRCYDENWNEIAQSNVFLYDDIGQVNDEQDLIDSIGKKLSEDGVELNSHQVQEERYFKDGNYILVRSRIELENVDPDELYQIYYHAYNVNTSEVNQIFIASYPKKGQQIEKVELLEGSKVLYVLSQGHYQIGYIYDASTNTRETVCKGGRECSKYL